MNGTMMETASMRIYDYEKICGSVNSEFPKQYSIAKRVTLKDQGDKGACVACALCSCAEYIWGKEMSEGFSYGMFRDDSHKTPGLYMSKALDYAKKVGFVPYDDFGILEEMPNIRVLAEKYPDLKDIATKYRISGYANLLYANRTKRDNAIKDAIMKGIGVPAASDDYFNESHAIMLTGWDDDKNAYEFQNSWGVSYGNNGVGYIPKDEITAVYAILVAPIELPFKDVSKDSWYYNDVEKQYFAGYINGTSETTFEPDRPITRAEFCAVNNRICKAEDENNARIFKVINSLIDRIVVLEEKLEGFKK